MIKQRLNEILEKIKQTESDVDKSETGNASAGRRVRKVCMEIIKELKEIRVEILENSKK